MNKEDNLIKSIVPDFPHARVQIALWKIHILQMMSNVLEANISGFEITLVSFL